MSKKSKTQEWRETLIKFKANGKEVEFKIIHNLPDTFGLSIEDALNNWIPRTEKHTADSFVSYISFKNTGYLAITEEYYESLKQQEDESK